MLLQSCYARRTAVIAIGEVAPSGSGVQGVVREWTPAETAAALSLFLLPLPHLLLHKAASSWLAR